MGTHCMSSACMCYVLALLLFPVCNELSRISGSSQLCDLCGCAYGYVCLFVHACACTYMHVCLHMYMCGAEDGIHDPVHAKQMLSPEPHPQPLRQME